MKREQLEKLLGKKVRIKLLDGKVFEGELHKTDEERYKSNPNLYYKKKYYFVSSNPYFIFRLSHVKKTEVLHDDQP